jgi:ParB family chromosome partitioning protein
VDRPKQIEPRGLRLDQILVPENRLRPVTDAAAARLAERIGLQGQLSPVVVHHSSAAARPYTLICGARRIRALELLGKSEVQAVLREKGEAPILEITDNLNADGLTQLETAEFLLAYRKYWEDRHGKIERGGDRKSKVQNAPLILPNYYKDLKEKLNIGKDVAKRLYRIGNLRPELKQVLRGTPVENEQGRLLTFAKMTIERQMQAAIAFKLTEGDVEATMKLLKPGAGRFPKDEWLRGQLIATVSRMSKALLVDTMQQIGYELVPIKRPNAAAPPPEIK